MAIDEDALMSMLQRIADGLDAIKAAIEDVQQSIEDASHEQCALLDEIRKQT
jgi:hypothetical protein